MSLTGAALLLWYSDVNSNIGMHGDIINLGV